MFLEYKPFDQNQFDSFDNFITNKNQTRFGKTTFGAFSRILFKHLEKCLSKTVFVPLAKHFPSIKYSIKTTTTPCKKLISKFNENSLHYFFEMVGISFCNVCEQLLIDARNCYPKNQILKD